MLFLSYLDDYRKIMRRGLFEMREIQSSKSFSP